MSPEQDLPNELKSLEASLASLRPSIGRLDRDRLMYLAGQQSVRAEVPRRARLRRAAWPAGFAAMTAVAAALLVALVVRPRPEDVERVVNLPALPGPLTSLPDRALPAGPESPSPRSVEPARPSVLALRLPGGLGAVTRRADYLRSLEEAAQNGPTRPSPSYPEILQSDAAAPGPVSYRDLLNSLLDGLDEANRDPSL